MQNKCGCGCDQGFVPVNSNWDFSGCDECQHRQTRRNSREDGNCAEGRKNMPRARRDDVCQCETHEENRRGECCEQNTHIRQEKSEYDMNDCGCQGQNRRNERRQCGECERINQRTGCSGCDDCTCETCVRMRHQHNNGCETQHRNCACVRRRSGEDGCEDNAITGTRSNRNDRVGMVGVEMQRLDQIFQSESALRAGTLFPELHKPMNGYCPCDGNCGTKAQAAAFAVWELRLYLDTHPDDQQALALLHKLANETCDPNYATTFLQDEACTEWTWTDDPWPWKFNCKCGD